MAGFATRGGVKSGLRATRAGGDLVKIGVPRADADGFLVL